MFHGVGFPFDFQEPYRGGSSKGPNHTSLYDILGVSPTATQSEIAAAYRKKAKEVHPDKAGSDELFSEINNAYNILSDSAQRKNYDEYGLDESGNVAQGGPRDILDVIFGGGGVGGGRRQSAGRVKGPNIEYTIQVTLEQIYSSAIRKMAVRKDVLCTTCKGYGAPQDAIEKCQTCNGTGVYIQITYSGSITQQTRAKCHKCRDGKVIPENKKCTQCEGVGTVKTRKTLEVYIEKGIPDGHQIKFTEEANEKLDTIPGDIKFTVETLPHKVFRRQGNHLIMTKEISLYECIVGYKFLLVHLDGRKIVIENDPNEVVEPGVTKAVVGEGMPIPRNPFEKGNLIIEFQIRMPRPKELHLQGEALKSSLKKILPAPPSPEIPNDEDIEYYKTTTTTAEMLADRSVESDDDDEPNARRGDHHVQCRQQ